MEKELKDMSENITLVRLDIRELATEIRNIKDMQATVNDHSTRLAKVEDKATVAHKRLDRVDKVIFWASTTMITAWLGLITWLVQK